jgi:phosphoribosyl 1,2-cyclic phosphate phosphodiesterase
MRVTILGSGTSSGVPTIGCTCPTCTSTDPRDRRTRPSIWIEADNGTSIVVDTSSDFREQCLRAGVTRLDAVVYTHHHFDHIAGFDDLRAFNYVLRRPVPVYMMQETLDHVKRIFSYAFGEPADSGSSRPVIETTIIDHEPIEIDGVSILPIPLQHGSIRVNGYRIGRFAYCTDCNAIPASSWKLLDGVEVLILDALRDDPHPTHFTLDEAVEVARRIGAHTTYLTHIAHDLLHAEADSRLPDGVRLGYDGLQIQL